MATGRVGSGASNAAPRSFGQADRAVHHRRNRMMARTKRDRRSYSAGEWGRNRVRVFAVLLTIRAKSRYGNGLRELSIHSAPGSIPHRSTRRANPTRWRSGLGRSALRRSRSPRLTRAPPHCCPLPRPRFGQAAVTASITGFRAVRKRGGGPSGRWRSTRGPAAPWPERRHRRTESRANAACRSPWPR